MGCDIHFYVEVLQNDVWQLAPGQLNPCENCLGTKLDPEKSHCSNCKKKLEEHEPVSGKCWFDFTTLHAVPVPCTWKCFDGKQLHDKYYGSRNYELFGILSGVRGRGVPGFTHEHRGMPADPSPELAYYSREPDWHSHTWYTLNELERHDWAASEEMHEFREALHRMRELASTYDDVRAVFWYDN